MSTIHVRVSMRMVMGVSMAVSMTMTTVRVSMPCQSIITTSLLKSIYSTEKNPFFCGPETGDSIMKLNWNTQEHYLKTSDRNKKALQRILTVSETVTRNLNCPCVSQTATSCPGYVEK